MRSNPSARAKYCAPAGRAGTYGACCHPGGWPPKGKDGGACRSGCVTKQNGPIGAVYFECVDSEGLQPVQNCLIPLTKQYGSEASVGIGAARASA
jgi:hypothetical protein